jgi:hypothetical protein
MFGVQNTCAAYVSDAVLVRPGGFLHSFIISSPSLGLNVFIPLVIMAIEPFLGTRAQRAFIATSKCSGLAV